jgi:hypothetical protein
MSKTKLVFGTLRAKHQSLKRAGDFHAVQMGLQRCLFYSFDYRYSHWSGTTLRPYKTNCPARGIRNNTSIKLFYFFHLLCLLLISQPAFLRYVCCPVLRLSFMADYFCCIYCFNAFYTYVTLNTLSFLSFGFVVYCVSWLLLSSRLLPLPSSGCCYVNELSFVFLSGFNILLFYFLSYYFFQFISLSTSGHCVLRYFVLIYLVLTF